MTPAEDLAVVRARLEHMVALATSDRAQPRYWAMSDADSAESRSARAYNHALSLFPPDLLLRVAQEALGVLDRHHDGAEDNSYDKGLCAAHKLNPPSWPCPEVTSVLRAWQP